MTKKEIVKTISEECDLTQLKTKEIVQRTFQAIIDTLVEDPRHRIELRNFGVFEVKKRAARKARNPRTGAKVSVPAKWVVTFKPGKEMEQRVLQLEEEDRRREEEQATTTSEAPAPQTSSESRTPPGYSSADPSADPQPKPEVPSGVSGPGEAAAS